MMADAVGGLRWWMMIAVIVSTTECFERALCAFESLSFFEFLREKIWFANRM